MRKINLLILLSLLSCGCLQKQRSGYTNLQGKTIVLKNVLIDTSWQETPYYTRFILLFDFSKYKGRFNKVKVNGFQKVNLITDDNNNFNYYLKYIESKDIDFKLYNTWTKSIPNFDFLGSDPDKVSEFHSFDSIKFKMKLYYKKEEIKRAIDSVQFSLALYDSQNNDTTFNFKYCIGKVKGW